MVEHKTKLYDDALNFLDLRAPREINYLNFDKKVLDRGIVFQFSLRIGLSREVVY